MLESGRSEVQMNEPKKYAVGGIELTKDDVAKIQDVVQRDGWELINLIMNKVQVDALESTFYAATPLDHSEYTHAHGQFTTVQRFVDFQKDLQEAIDAIVSEEPGATATQN